MGQASRRKFEATSVITITRLLPWRCSGDQMDDRPQFPVHQNADTPDVHVSGWGFRCWHDWLSPGFHQTNAHSWSRHNQWLVGPMTRRTNRAIYRSETFLFRVVKRNVEHKLPSIFPLVDHVWWFHTFMTRQKSNNTYKNNRWDFQLQERVDSVSK